MAEGGSVDEEKRATLRQFAALGAVGPFARLAEDEPDSGGGSDARNAILGYLGTTPGAHFSKVRDDLSLGTGETQHHLRQLVDAGVVESYRDGEYRRFVPAERFTSFDKLALGYLRRETPRGMLVALLADPDLTGSELASILDVSPATVSTCASELVEVGLLARDDGYRIEHPETLIALLIRYADSFDERTVSFASRAHELFTYDP